nr:protein phosphatase 2C domain-containing protein [Lachnoclostridium phocaeense]
MKNRQMRQYEISCYISQGKERRECKDVEYTLISGDRQVFSLSDGVTKKKYAVQGARKVQEALGSCLAGMPDEELWSDEKVKRRCIDLLRDTIRDLSEQAGADREEFASTLMMLAAQRDTGKIRWIHIGDGLIFQTQDGQVQVVSHPRYGITPKYTFATTSQNMERHFRTGVIDRPERVGMMTDGAMARFYRERELTDLARQVLVQKMENVEEVLRRQEEKDDQSLFLIQYSDPA